MAETSGFFEATWDDELLNPDTGEYGDWDIKYFAEQFANYFKLFIGNGVFSSPANQLLVSAGTGLNVTLSTGWAFINGYWYHNDAAIVLPVPGNSTSNNRVDSVLLRWNLSTKEISVLYNTGSTDVTRGETVYDLKLAEVIVPPNASQILGSNITDTRIDGAACGLVTGLLNVIDAEDFYQQMEEAFEEWFDDIKDQLTGDLGVRLQLEFTQLNADVETYYNNTTQQIAGYNQNYQQTLSATQAAASTAQGLVNDYVNNDFVIPLQTLTFTNKVCTISNSKVTANSLIDVYFTAGSMQYAEDAIIVVDSSAGTITLTAENQPEGTIQAVIRVRVG